MIRLAPEGPCTVFTQVARRRATGVGDQKQQPAQFDALFRLERPVRRLGSKPRDGEAGEPIIVDHAAIEQLDVMHFAGVIAVQRIGKEPKQWRRVGVAANALRPKPAAGSDSGPDSLQ